MPDTTPPSIESPYPSSNAVATLAHLLLYQYRAFSALAEAKPLVNFL